MKFAKGTSGNPAGRPSGRPDKRQLLRHQIAGHAPELIELAVKQAKAGDSAALGLLLARCVAPLRPAGEPVQFEMAPEANLADQARAVLAAIADGKLDPHTGRALVDAIAAVGRVVELDEIERRLAALETGSTT